MEKISYRDEEKTLSKVAATLHFVLDKRLQSSKSRWKDREEGKNKIRFWQCSGRLELIWHTALAEDQVTHDPMQFSNFCTPVISHFRKEKLLSREKRDEIGLNFSLENTFF